MRHVLKYSTYLAFALVLSACGSDSAQPVDFSTQETPPEEVAPDASTPAIDAGLPDPPTIEFEEECIVEGAVGRCSYGGMIDGECVALYNWMPERCNGIDDNCDGFNDHYPEGVDWPEQWGREVALLQAELERLGERPIEELAEFEGYCWDVCVGPSGPVDLRVEVPTTSRRYEVLQWMENDKSPSGEPLFCRQY